MDKYPNNHRSESHFGRNILMAGAGIAVAAFGVSHLIDDGIGNIDLPTVPLEIDSPEPVKATATVLQTTYRHETSYNYTCVGDDSVGVAVDAIKEGWDIPLLGSVGDGHFKKILFFKFANCLDNETAQLEYVEEHEVSTTMLDGEQTSQTDSVKKVTAELPGLIAVRPSLNSLDPRNCVNARPGDTNEELQAKIAKRQQKIANGQEVECDTGFDNGPEGSSNDSVKVIPFGYAAGQLAAVLDARPNTTYYKETQALEKLRTDFETYLHGKYPDAEVVVTFSDDLPTPADRLEQRLKTVCKDLPGMFKKVYFERGKNGLLQLNAIGHDEEEATVQFSEDTAINDQELQNLNQTLTNMINIGKLAETPAGGLVPSTTQNSSLLDPVKISDNDFANICGLSKPISDKSLV